VIDVDRDAPQVRIIPPLVYLAGLVIGFVANLWWPVKFMPDMMAWTTGGVLIVCGAALAGSALFRFRNKPDAVMVWTRASTHKASDFPLGTVEKTNAGN